MQGLRSAPADRRHYADCCGEAREVGGAGLGPQQDHRVARGGKALR